MRGSNRIGKVGRQLKMQVDLVRIVGPTTAWRSRRQMAPKAPVRPPGREALYIELWKSAGRAVGATCTELPDGFLEFERDGRSTIVWSNLVPLDDPVTLKLAGNKPVTHALLEREGVPAAAQLAIDWRDVAAARAFLGRHGRIVVKPASSTGRGTGVTCGVRNDHALDRALQRAAGWDTQVVLEPHAVGTEYRLLVLDGETIGVVARRPPHVVGDGQQDIADLIAAENRARADAGGARGLWPIRIDLDCVLTLEHLGLSLTSVPDAGAAVQVKSAVNENAAHENETITPVPEALARVGAAAARAVGSRLVSVEVITPTTDGELSDVGGSVIEINTTPGILYHAQVADPETATPVAERILETLLQEGRVHEALRLRR